MDPSAQSVLTLLLVASAWGWLVRRLWRARSRPSACERCDTMPAAPAARGRRSSALRVVSFSGGRTTTRSSAPQPPSRSPESDARR